MSYTVKAVFTFKNQDCKEKFITFCNGEKGLSVTREWSGCHSIECYEANDNVLEVNIWQKWENQESHESYVKYRHESGSFDFLGELISSPPVITPLRSLVLETDKEQIEKIVNDMCSKEHHNSSKHMHNKCLIIRPSGNPLDTEGYSNMMKSQDVVVDSNNLVSINKLDICGNMAYVCYTSHGKFTYKGAHNDDIAVFTSVLKKDNGRWNVVHGQRSSGRKPSEELPVFP